MKEEIKKQMRECLSLLDRIINEGPVIEQTAKTAEVILDALRSRKKVLFFGNGGSAADAQHLAAELVSRFKKERPGIPAIALTTDTSILTAISNDYDFSVIFRRQIEALGNPGDIAFGISTSGNSKNVTEAFRFARERGIVTIGLLGKDGGENKKFADHCIIIQDDNTPRIQEMQILIGHIICDLIENKLFS